MSIMEKDRPTVGKALWGDSPVSVTKFKSKTFDNPTDKDITIEDPSDKDPSVNSNNFSKNIRYDENLKTARPLDANAAAPAT
jgi:hypothetical protein